VKLLFVVAATGHFSESVLFVLVIELQEVVKLLLFLLPCIDRLLKSLVFLPDILPKLSNLVDQLHIAMHHVEMLLLVDLSLLIKPLFDAGYRVVQVLLLVFVLGLDVFVQLHVLHRLILYILMQGLLDSALKLVIVVDVLHCVENCVFEALDVSVV
jgi:hypothetical protein